MIKNLISQVDQIEDESLKELIEQEEKELNEMKLKEKNIENIKITRMKVVKQKPELKPSIRDKVEKKDQSV
jgi:hypothetical protein